DVSRDPPRFRDLRIATYVAPTRSTPSRRLGIARTRPPGLPPSLRRPPQPRPARAVMPGQAIAVDPRPPEPQPGRQQRHRAHRIADPESAPRRPRTLRTGQVQPPGTHADGLAAAAPADR